MRCARASAPLRLGTGGTVPVVAMAAAVSRVLAVAGAEVVPCASALA